MSWEKDFEKRCFIALIRFCTERRKEYCVLIFYYFYCLFALNIENSSKGKGVELGDWKYSVPWFFNLEILTGYSK